MLISALYRQALYQLFIYRMQDYNPRATPPTLSLQLTEYLAFYPGSSIYYYFFRSLKFPIAYSLSQ